MKCDYTKRLIAFIIDVVIIYLITYTLYKIELSNDEMKNFLICELIVGFLFLFRDLFFIKKSLGKHIMKIYVINLQTERVSNPSVVSRNLIFMIPYLISYAINFHKTDVRDLWFLGMVLFICVAIIEGIFILHDRNGQRIGDFFSDTKVIEV